eukprot:Hpha_TRINITY_DN14231_c0_g2::TRINITY_DN14231_c0_g2_i1::g.22481::m.22481
MGDDGWSDDSIPTSSDDEHRPAGAGTYLAFLELQADEQPARPAAAAAPAQQPAVPAAAKAAKKQKAAAPPRRSNQSYAGRGRGGAPAPRPKQAQQPVDPPHPPLPDPPPQPSRRGGAGGASERQRTGSLRVVGAALAGRSGDTPPRVSRHTPSPPAAGAADEADEESSPARVVLPFLHRTSLNVAAVTGVFIAAAACCWPSPPTTPVSPVGALGWDPVVASSHPGARLTVRELRERAGPSGLIDPSAVCATLADSVDKTLARHGIN